MDETQGEEGQAGTYTQLSLEKYGIHIHLCDASVDLVGVER